MTKREAIVLAAVELFERYGPAKTTIEDIVSAAGVAKGTFYNHFRDKDAVFLEVADTIVAELRQAMAKASAGAQTCREKIRARWLTAARRFHRFHQYVEETYESFPSARAEMDQRRRRYLAEEIKATEAILREGTATGEIRVADVQLTAQTLVVGIGIARLEAGWMFKAQQADLETVLDELLRMLFEGLHSR